MTKIRWGILGVAKIATKRFIPALTEAKNTELAAVGSRSLDKAVSTAREFCASRFFGSSQWAKISSLLSRNVQILERPYHAACR